MTLKWQLCGFFVGNYILDIMPLRALLHYKMFNRFQAAVSLARLSRHRYLLEITFITYSPSPVSASTYSISLSMLD